MFEADFTVIGRKSGNPLKVLEEKSSHLFPKLIEIQPNDQIDMCKHSALCLHGNEDIKQPLFADPSMIS